MMPDPVWLIQNRDGRYLRFGAPGPDAELVIDWTHARKEAAWYQHRRDAENMLLQGLLPGTKARIVRAKNHPAWIVGHGATLHRLRCENPGCPECEAEARRIWGDSASEDPEISEPALLRRDAWQKGLALEAELRAGTPPGVAMDFEFCTADPGQGLAILAIELQSRTRDPAALENRMQEIREWLQAQIPLPPGERTAAGVRSGGEIFLRSAWPVPILRHGQGDGE